MATSSSKALLISSLVQSRGLLIENSRFVFLIFFFFSSVSPSASPPPSTSLVSVSSSSISSTICAELRLMIPWISSFTLTRIFFRSPGVALIWKLQMLFGEVSANPNCVDASSYDAVTENSPALLRVTRRTIGKLRPRSNMTTELVDSAVSAASAGVSSQDSLIGYGWDSWISYGNTLKRGDRIALWSAVPRATASSAFIVVDRVLTPKISIIWRLTAPIRVVPPTISTDAKSVAVRFASVSAFSIGTPRRSNNGLQRASYSSALREQAKSKSSIRHSRLMRASLTPCGLSVFFALSAASNNFMRTLGFSIGSAESLFLYFSWNLVEIHWAMARSKSRPPSDSSEKVDLTTSLPGSKETRETE
mmetsp:Transcript_38744/g.54559  ORF Transcript_38744/g.54559 Transcript_38744/m.54559 type:complete len:363 (-) Transcript_38744:683-1771(-)